MENINNTLVFPKVEINVIVSINKMISKKYAFFTSFIGDSAHAKYSFTKISRSYYDFSGINIKQ